MTENDAIRFPGEREPDYTHSVLLHLPQGPYLLRTGSGKTHLDPLTKEQSLDFLHAIGEGPTLSLNGLGVVEVEEVVSGSDPDLRLGTIATTLLMGNERGRHGRLDFDDLRDLYTSGDSSRLVRMQHDGKALYGLLKTDQAGTARLVLFVSRHEDMNYNSGQLLTLFLTMVRNRMAQDNEDLKQKSWQVRESIQQSLREGNTTVEPVFDEYRGHVLAAELLAGRYVRLKTAEFESAEDKQNADKETQEMERVVASVQTTPGRFISAIGNVTFHFDLTHLMCDKRVKEEDLTEVSKPVVVEPVKTEEPVQSLVDELGEQEPRPERITIRMDDLKEEARAPISPWWETEHQVDQDDWPFSHQYIGQVDTLLTQLEVARRNFDSRSTVDVLYRSLTDRLRDLFPLMDGRNSATNTTLPAPYIVPLENQGSADEGNDSSNLGLSLGVNEIGHWFVSADRYVQFLDNNGHFRQSPKGEKDYTRKKMYIDILGHTLSDLANRGLWHELPQVLWHAHRAMDRSM